MKYNPQGDLVFVGRTDTQIKRLGYRIELGEIDAAALAQPGVERACTVHLPESGDMVLCVQGPAVDLASLEAGLHQALPRYMRPTRVAVLPEVPLNPNGKTDRSALSQLVRGLAAGGLPPRDG